MYHLYKISKEKGICQIKEEFWEYKMTTVLTENNFFSGICGI